MNSIPVATSVEMEEVRTAAQWKAFFYLPWDIYRSDSSWVPPLVTEQRKLLDRSKNPFFKHAEYNAWLVKSNGKYAGRILAYVDHRCNEFYQDRIGFFGFFETVDDFNIGSRLFHYAASWLKGKGMRIIRGPVNLDISNECGILLNGFEYPPYLQMGHNPPYYHELFEAAGFGKGHDLLSYRLNRDMILSDNSLLERLARISRKVMDRKGIRIRSLDMSRYKTELASINDLYNAFMNQNWGYVPTTIEDMLFTGSSLRQIVNPDMVLFVELDGEVVGCSVSIPDINQVFARLNGRLLPFGIFKFMYYQRKINRMRLMLLGVQQNFRLKGMDVLLYYYTIAKAFEHGIEEAELSWISEDNHVLVSIVEQLGAELYKRYRVYETIL